MSDHQKNEDQYEEAHLQQVVLAVVTVIFIAFESQAEKCRLFRPTVHVALGCIEEKTEGVLTAAVSNGFIRVSEEGQITLTETGMKAALTCACNVLPACIGYK